MTFFKQVMVRKLRRWN